MNWYFLVEGKTERRIYPQWISYLMPHLSRINSPGDAQNNNYYLISGGGFPSLLDNHLADSIADINACGNYDWLILALDADFLSISERMKEVYDFITDKNLTLHNCTLEIIVQNRCIETWFLGNQKVYSRNPTLKELIDFIRFYNVSDCDPELMDKPSTFEGTLSDYHYEYLKQMLFFKNIRYSKTKPYEVGKAYYIEELKKRLEKTPTHLSSLKKFFDLCDSIQ